MLSSALLLEYIACIGCLVCAVYGDGVCCQCMVLVTAASVGAMYGDASVVEELRVYGDASVGAAVSSQRPAASFPVSLPSACAGRGVRARAFVGVSGVEAIAEPRAPGLSQPFGSYQCITMQSVRDPRKRKVAWLIAAPTEHVTG